MKLYNYLPDLVKLDKANQLRVEVSHNTLKKLWQNQKKNTSSEDLKHQIIYENKLEITTRSFENYLYKNTFPLYFAKILIDRFGEHKTWDQIYSNMQRICFRSTSGGKTQWVKLPKDITTDFAYLAGALRDGNVTLTNGRIKITQKSNKKWLISKIKPILQRLFGVIPTIKGDATIYSFPIVYFLIVVLGHPPGKQTTWKTPKWIIKLSLNLKAAYVKGYFDAEGTSNTKRMKIALSQGWYKKEIAPSLMDIKDILRQFGITSTLEGPYRERENWAYMSNIVIYCKQNPRNGILFYEKIGTEHSDKIKSLRKIYVACQNQLVDSHNRA